MKICKRLVLGFVMCLTLVGVLNLEADAKEPIDVDAKGSITVEYAYDTKPLGDVNFKIYRVATVSADERYTPVEKIVGSGIDFNQLVEQEDWQDAIEILDFGIEAGEIEADYEIKTDETGHFLLENLPTGMYFIRVDASKYEGKITASESVLHPLQIYSDETFTWDYDLEITPKIELKDQEKPEVPKEDEPDKNNDKELPQTGTMKWMISVLASLGMMFIVLGTLLRRKCNE